MRRILTALLVAVVAILVYAGYLVAHPDMATAPTGDAIFVHAGGRGERARAAIDLFEAGAAPVLVFSDPGVRSSSVPRGICGSSDSVVCITPPSVDTAGEARALGAIAAERGWDEVIIVTSDYHLRRAAALDRSCTDATIEGIPAPSTRTRSPITDARVQETFGLVFGWLFQRCP